MKHNMKLTKSKLKQLILEELANILVQEEVPTRVSGRLPPGITVKYIKEGGFVIATAFTNSS